MCGTKLRLEKDPHISSQLILPKVEKISQLGMNRLFLFLKDFIYFLERGDGEDKERERKISVWLPLTCPQLGTWPTSQACALTGNRTGDSLVHRPTLNPLSYTSQGWITFFKKVTFRLYLTAYTKLNKKLFNTCTNLKTKNINFSENLEENFQFLEIGQDDLQQNTKNH